MLYQHAFRTQATDWHSSLYNDELAHAMEIMYLPKVVVKTWQLCLKGYDATDKIRPNQISRFES